MARLAWDFLGLFRWAATAVPSSEPYTAQIAALQNIALASLKVLPVLLKELGPQFSFAPIGRIAIPPAKHVTDNYTYTVVPVGEVAYRYSRVMSKGPRCPACGLK